MNKIEITILDRPTAADKKTAVFPSRRVRKLGRRRTGEAQIRFYDLGQVNHEALDAEPVWSDHPILKTPSYTTTHIAWGSGPRFAGVTYSVDPFVDSDFLAYRTMMFNYPVTEWRQRYRRITGLVPYSDQYTFDMRFSLRDTTITGTNETFMPSRAVLRSSPTFETDRDTMLTAWHHYWDNDRDYAGYLGLDELTGQYDPQGVGDIPGGYFPYSNNKDIFKVTATYDPDAVAVDPFEPSGSYDIFLMPQIGMFLATANSTDWKTTEVLGLCYQVMPRYLWPRYLEDPNTTGTGGMYGSDSAVTNWLEYQKGRSGVQGSTWTYTGVDNAPGDYSYTEASLDPSDWTAFSKWGSAVFAEPVEPGGAFYSPQSRGREVADVVNQFTTSIRANVDDPNFSRSIFQAYDPILTAVIQKGGQFYYVWDICDSVEGFGAYTAYEILDQNVRYKLSRGITWDSGYTGGGGLQPRDGTGDYEY